MSFNTLLLNSKTVLTSEPYQPLATRDDELIGRTRECRMILAAWGAQSGLPPLAPLLVGEPGVGKNRVVYELARCTQKPLYALQGHEDITAEDLVCAVRFSDAPDRKMDYILSPLATAMQRGGICFIDEVGKLRPKALAPFASVLDERRYLDSTLLGERIHANPSFRFVAATNTVDIAGEGLPDFIHSRLRPLIEVGYPSRKELEQIVKARFERIGDDNEGLLRRFWELWGEHKQDTAPSPRDTIYLFGLTLSLADAEAANTAQQQASYEKTFLLKTIPGQALTEDHETALPSDLPDPWKEPLHSRENMMLLSSRHTWIPWDNLVNGLSWEAIRRSGKREYVRVPEEFSGQILEGIDVKTTLRAQARGEQKLFVHNSRMRLSSAPSDLTEGLPVIWLFDADPETGDCEYECYHEALSLTLPYARDPSLFRREASESGGSAVAMIAFGKDNYDDPVLSPREINARRFDLRGAVVFVPLFPQCRQFARWFERTNFARNPLIGYSSWTKLRAAAMEEIERHLEAQPASLRWQDMLVCAAIPYGGQSMTVVAPSTFELAPVVHHFAARRGKTVEMVSLERFPQRYVKRLRKNYMVGGQFNRESDTVVYDTGAERVLGEPLDLYLDHVPSHWREFGLD